MAQLAVPSQHPLMVCGLFFVKCQQGSLGGFGPQPLLAHPKEGTKVSVPFVSLRFTCHNLIATTYFSEHREQVGHPNSTGEGLHLSKVLWAAEGFSLNLQQLPTG